MKELNFLPRTFVDARRRVRILRMQSLAIAAILCALTVFLTTSKVLLSRVEAETVHARHTEELLGRQGVQMQQLKRRESELLRRQEIQRRLGNWVPRSSVLLLISRILPQGVGVINMSMVQKRVRKDRTMEVGLNETGPNVRSRGRARSRKARSPSKDEELYTELTLTGVAPSDVHIAQVVADMEAHAAYSNVRLTYSRHRLADERILREFQVSCKLVEKELEKPVE